MNFGPKTRSETSGKPSRNDPRVNFRFRFRKVVNLESELGVQFGPVQVRKLMEYSPLSASIARFHRVSKEKCWMV